MLLSFEKHYKVFFYKLVNLNKIIFDENTKSNLNVKITKKKLGLTKVTKLRKYEILNVWILTSPTSSHPLDSLTHICGPKRNFEKFVTQILCKIIFSLCWFNHNMPQTFQGTC